MRGVVTSPGKRKDVKAAKAYLEELDATEVVVSVNNHLHIDWQAHGRHLGISLATAPRSTDESACIARQLIRRRYREIGVEVRA